MVNSVMLTGRLTKNIEGNTIVLAVYRQFKNEEGTYETDFIPVEIFGGILEKAKEYIAKGDLVGIRGRVETKDDKVVLIAEKLTFLSSNKQVLKENGVE